MGDIIRADARRRIASLYVDKSLYGDLAPQGFAYVRPEPAVSIVQALFAAVALAAVNVTLFVWLVGAA